jgi:uncharacterized membrane protein
MQSLLQVGLYLQVSGITPWRAVALVAIVLGVTGVVIGRKALTRSARHISSGRPMGMVALGVGLIDIIGSGLQLSRATGGPGTGNGVIGSGVAIVLGLISMVLGARALAQSRRMGSGSSTAAPVNSREKT